jgi:hypothetical protein
MFSDSHFEIERRRDHWRISAHGLPALAFALAVGAIGVAIAFWWISSRISGMH